MTPRERAREATWDTGGHDWTTVDRERLESRVEQAITAAVEAERERWKTAVRKYVRPKYLADNVIRDMENCNSIATETKNT